MLIDLVQYKSEVTLIRDSGIQFLDFGMSLPADLPKKGYFVRKTANGPLLNLNYDVLEGKFSIPCEVGDTPEIVRPELNVEFSKSIEILEGVWLPLPYLRKSSQNNHISGPDNWSRVQIRRLERPDMAGNTLRISIALDTKIVSEEEPDPTVSPTSIDIDHGTRFSFASLNDEIASFLDNTWVDSWLREVFINWVDNNEARCESDLAYAMKMFEYQAHYLNILRMMAEQLPLPKLVLVDKSLVNQVIPVDLVLDVGSTHTCGIVIEDHGAENDGMRQCSAIRLRSLSKPQFISNPLFSSRIEFSDARFGKSNYSLESGREAAFSWPSIVRVGDEATELTRLRAGSEGASGLSSPRRYLWDSAPTTQPWRFSNAIEDEEKLAIALPVMNLINDEGIPLFKLLADDRLPVFSPRYSRSSLMTLMLSELLTQTLMQINSPASRLQHGHVNAPRQIRHIILTLPSAMPGQERESFRMHMNQALAIVWKGLGWHPRDMGFTTVSEKAASIVPVPTISTDWDEASCSQLVWIYNESLNYPGHLSTLFRTLIRPDRMSEQSEVSDRHLHIASIDIGGGTTDMAITRYDMNDDTAGNIKIIPHIIFREGFKNAGDDLLLEIIQREVMTSLEKRLQNLGVKDCPALLHRLFGASFRNDDHSTLRQQATLQIMIPLGHSILSAWEDNNLIEANFGQILTTKPSEKVLSWINKTVELDGGLQDFDILATTLRVEPSSLNKAVLTGYFSLTKTLQSMCEAIEYYNCDLLLLSGCPGSLPGIESFFRRRQPVPASRLITMKNYTLHSSFPFNTSTDRNLTKTTAATGAMLYQLAMDLRLPGFNFSSGNISTSSTMKYFGVMDEHNLITEENILFKHRVNSESPDEITFAVRGNVRLGFRQLGTARWPATPLYRLSILDPKLARSLSGNRVLYVRLKRYPDSDAFKLINATLDDGEVVPCEQLSLALCTLTESNSTVREYWIDSGSLYK